MNLTRRTFLQMMGALGAAVALKQDFITPKEAAALDEPIVSSGLGLFFHNEKQQWQKVGDIATFSGPSMELEIIDCTSLYDDSWRGFKPFRDSGEISVSLFGNPASEIEAGFHTARRLAFQLRFEDYRFEFDAYPTEMSKSCLVKGVFETNMRLRLIGPMTIT